jgi:hypothetical protein
VKIGTLISPPNDQVRADPTHSPDSALPRRTPGERNRREILGARRANARVGGHQVLLGQQQIRPLFKQRRRQPHGHRGQHQIADFLAARHVARVFAEQSGQQILLQRHLLLELFDRHLSRRIFRARLRILDLGHHAALKAVAEHLERVGAAAQRVLRDAQPVVEIAQRHVGAGHRRHHADFRAAARLFARGPFGPRRCGEPTHAAEHVDFPRGKCVDAHLIERVVERHAAAAAALTRCRVPPNSAPTCGNSPIAPP